MGATSSAQRLDEEYTEFNSSEYHSKIESELGRFVANSLSQEDEGRRSVKTAETISCISRNPSSVTDVMRQLRRNWESVLKSAQVSRGVEALFLAKANDLLNVFFRTNFPHVGAPGVLGRDYKIWYAHDSGQIVHSIGFVGRLYAMADPPIPSSPAHVARQPIDVEQRTVIFFLVGRCEVLQYPSPDAERSNSDGLVATLERMMEERATNNASGEPMTFTELLEAVTSRMESEGRNYSAAELTSAMQTRYASLWMSGEH